MLESPSSEHVVADIDESPIFIVGTGRSGTTLLRQMLNAHPRIHITHEACFYTYERQASRYVSASDWLERYFQTYSFAWLHLDPQKVRAALPRELPRERIAEAYRAIMREKARQMGKQRYGEKNPLDTQNLGRIFRDFADPRVVFIMRDPRPTTLSFNRVPFATSSALLNAGMCGLQFNHVRPYLDRILEVRLEDLTADPHPVLQSILRFVGEPWDDAVLEHLKHSPTGDVPPLPWFVGATQRAPSQQLSDGSWRERLDPAWIRLIERLNRRGMEHYGYPLAVLPREPTFWDLARAVAKDLPGIAATLGNMLSLMGKFHRHFDNEEFFDPQLAMEQSIGLNPAAWRYYPDFLMPRVPQLPEYGTPP